MRSLVPLTKKGSLVGVTQDDEWGGFAFAENGRFVSVRDRNWKLIVRRDGVELETFQKDSVPEADFVRRPRLFHLKADPGETNDLWRNAALQKENEAEALRMLSVLAAWSDSMPIPISHVVQSARDAEDSELFTALGYGDMLEEDDSSEAPQESTGDAE